MILLAPFAHPHISYMYYLRALALLHDPGMLPGSPGYHSKILSKFLEHGTGGYLGVGAGLALFVHACCELGWNGVNFIFCLG